jgi:hypothetical protein
MPAGCRFMPRCAHAEPACDAPQDLSHGVRCRRSAELELPGALA